LTRCVVGGGGKLVCKFTPVRDALQTTDISYMVAEEIDHEMKLALYFLRILELEELLLELDLHCACRDVLAYLLLLDIL
jgi:hypothetical protein